MPDNPPFKDLPPNKPARPVVISHLNQPEHKADQETTDYPQAAAAAPDSDQDELGDHYRILALLGRGGMGNVYKVLDLRTNQIVAVKVIRAELSRDTVAVKRFRREADAAMGLLHPNLVPVYGQGTTTSGAPYIVMEYQDGQSLSDLLKLEGALDVDYALHIIEEVALALEHAHGRGIVHRDLKPGNILINTEGKVRVVDFGIAKVFNQERQSESYQALTNLTKTGDFFGSPAYMSPEQCLGKELDSRSDIYSLGCVAHELLSGQPPFGDGNPVQTILNHINQPAEALRKTKHGEPIPAKLTELLQACLEKDPDNRPHSMGDLRKHVVNIQMGDRTPQAVPKPRALQERVFSGTIWPKYMAIFCICAFQMAILASQYANHDRAMRLRAYTGMTINQYNLALKQIDYSYEVITTSTKKAENQPAFKALYMAQAACKNVPQTDNKPPQMDPTLMANYGHQVLSGCIDSMQNLADLVERPEAHTEPGEREKDMSTFVRRREEAMAWITRLRNYNFGLRDHFAVEWENFLFLITLIGCLFLTVASCVMLFGTKHGKAQDD